LIPCSHTLLEAQDCLGTNIEGTVGTLLLVDTDPPGTPCLTENALSRIIEAYENDDSTRDGSKINLAGYSFDLLSRQAALGSLLIGVPACGEFQWNDGAIP
jgi:hypothetical protein